MNGKSMMVAAAALIIGVGIGFGAASLNGPSVETCLKAIAKADHELIEQREADWEANAEAREAAAREIAEQRHARRCQTLAEDTGKDEAARAKILADCTEQMKALRDRM